MSGRTRDVKMACVLVLMVAVVSTAALLLVPFP